MIAGYSAHIAAVLFVVSLVLMLAAPLGYRLRLWSAVTALTKVVALGLVLAALAVVGAIVSLATGGWEVGPGTTIMLVAIIVVGGVAVLLPVRAKAMRYDSVKLFELARYLVPDDPSLVQEVREAVEHPRDYVQRYAERLSNRGIDKPMAALPWIALADGLQARDRLREVDWKDNAEEVAWNLDQLSALKPPRAERWTWLEAPPWDKAIPEQSLPAIGKRLRQEGLALVTLDIDSDSYLLMVLAPERVDEARRLAAAAGYGKIATWGAEP
jgi:hypothetical protein